MKKIITVVNALFLTLCILPGRAGIIDDFSGTTQADSGNYNAIQAYDGGGSQAFSISEGQLDPTGTGQSTYAFLWNAGQSLGDTTFGESVSIDAVNINFAALAGIRFSTSDSSLGNDSLEAGILGYSLDNSISNLSATTGNVYVGGVLAPLTLNFALGSVTETFTRVSDTLFDYTFAGPGLTSGPVTDSFTYAAAAGQDVYFGPDFYADGNAGAQIEDNLAYNPVEVPEPSSYAMMFAGLAFLGVLIRRKSVRFTA